MNTYIVKGDICFSRSMDEIVCLEQGSIVVEQGREMCIRDRASATRGFGCTPPSVW